MAKELRPNRGWISEGGIVACGQCVQDEAYTAGQSTEARIRYHASAWKPYNPKPGDDFCSICDRDITERHPNIP